MASAELTRPEERNYWIDVAIGETVSVVARKAAARIMERTVGVAAFWEM